PVDYVKYAESFGAKGLRVTQTDQLASTLAEAFQTSGPVIVQIPVDYRDNQQLKSQLLTDVLN
ncbi:acetolactate synthase AlsS, partial [Levilactobacillus brevis]|nr:acetolactate synthase AlsS [Levilactobacillus brevis]